MEHHEQGDEDDAEERERQAMTNTGAMQGHPPVTFTLDGVEYTVADRRQKAADVLRLAGLDPGHSSDGAWRGQTARLVAGHAP